MATAVTEKEKTSEELRREIEELRWQQREITERLRDPRGIRKGISPRAGPGFPRVPNRNGLQRGIVRRPGPGDFEEPPLKKRLLSTVVKVNGSNEEDDMEGKEIKDGPVEEKESHEEVDDQFAIGSGRREFRKENEHKIVEPVPRVLPKVEDPKLAKRNRRMFGALLGTLEKFREEDQKLSASEALRRRSDSLRRAEQKAQEESERLFQQELHQLAERRKKDLVLRARLSAKAEEKHLELLFITWTEHQLKLCSFLKTKAEPSIFYMPAKPLDDDDENRKEERRKEFAEWKQKRREEINGYQEQILSRHLAKVEADFQRWQNQSQSTHVPEEMEEDEIDDTCKEAIQATAGPDIATEDNLEDSTVNVSNDRLTEETEEAERLTET